MNPALVGWAFRLTKDIGLADTPAIRTARARFTGFPNALKPPFVTHGDTISGSTFWHATRMDAWANAWARYFSGGNYMIAPRENSGTMHALPFLSHARPADP